MFSGVYTATITPFKFSGEVDYGALGKLIDFQIENGVDGIVPCGTTGESPTLNEDYTEVINFSVAYVDKRAKVIAGTGFNSTKKTIEMTRFAESIGVDGVLLVAPYYNKPSQRGLYEHFRNVAGAVSIPCIVYNIKGRTGVNVETSTLVNLMSECENIVGVKEASGDLNQIREVIEKRRDGFSVLSGDDNLTLKVIESGGDGVVSVVSNIVPDKIVQMVYSALKGEVAKYRDMWSRLEELTKAMFIETNPRPIKTALAMQGRCEEIFRLPLCTLDFEKREELRRVLSWMNLV